MKLCTSRLCFITSIFRRYFLPHRSQVEYSKQGRQRIIEKLSTKLLWTLFLNSFVAWIFWFVHVDPMVVQMVFGVEYLSTSLAGQVQVLMLFGVNLQLSNAGIHFATKLTWYRSHTLLQF